MSASLAHVDAAKVETRVPKPHARTILGPLTTTFTPNAVCTVPDVVCTSASAAYYAQTCADTGAGDATACWPPATQGAKVPKQPFNGWGFYSPGTLCPSGYAPACSATFGGLSSQDAGWTFQFSLTSGETAVGCCPKDMQCTMVAGGVQTCRKLVARSALATASCQGPTSVYGQWTLPATYTSISQPPTENNTTPAAVTVKTVVSTIMLLAPLIQINHRVQDLPPTATATSPLTSTSDSSVIVATSTATTAAAAGGGGLSSGGITGVFLGSVIGVSMVAAALGLLYTRRRRKQAQLPQEMEDTGPSGIKEASDVPRPVVGSELPGDTGWLLSRNSDQVSSPLPVVPRRPLPRRSIPPDGLAASD